jgi:hypothetical protein
MLKNGAGNMADQYNWKFLDMKDLDAWLENNQAIINRCTFDHSWRWSRSSEITSDYVDVVKIHLHELPIHKDYDIRSNESFFRMHEVGKTIGHWQGELFHRIGNLLRSNGIQTSSAMSTQKGCYAYSKYESLKTIKQISQLIETHFGLLTRIHCEGKGDCTIYIHNDRSVLDSLELKEPEKSKKGERKGGDIRLQADTELDKREKELLAELDKIRKLRNS